MAISSPPERSKTQGRVSSCRRGSGQGQTDEKSGRVRR